MKRSKSSSDEGLTQTSNRQQAVQIRASRPTDVRHLARLEAIIDECTARGEIESYRHRDRLEEALSERWMVLAVREREVVGFAMALPWESGKFVGTGPSLVMEEFRIGALSSRLTERIAGLSRRRWPGSILMGLSLTRVQEGRMIAHGFEPVPYCDLTSDLAFWDGCRGCEHYGHLKRNQYQDCHCWVGVQFPPGEERERVIPKDALTRPRPDLRYRAGE